MRSADGAIASSTSAIPELAGDAIEQDAGRVPAARSDAIARRDADRGQVRAQDLPLDPRDGRRHREQDVSALGRQHVRHQRGAVEGRLLHVDRPRAPGAQPRGPRLVEIAGEGPELGDDDRFVLLPLGGQRLLEEREPGGRIGDRDERLGRGREHPDQELRRLVVRAHLGVRARELEACLVERRVDGDRPLQVGDAVAEARERVHLELAERREPARVDPPQLVSEADDRGERPREPDLVHPVGAAKERRQPGEGARVRGRRDDGLHERPLGRPRVGEPHVDLGELEEEGRLLLGIALGVREATEPVGHLLAASPLRRLVGGRRLGRDPAQQRAQRSHVGRVELEGGAQGAVDLVGPEEDLLEDARQREERRQLRADLAAGRHDRLERVHRLGPRALRDAQLREREQRGHVLGRHRADPAHGVDRDGQIAQVVAGHASDLGAEEHHRVGRSRRGDRLAERADEALALALLEQDGREAPGRRDRVGLGLQGALEHRRWPACAARRSGPGGGPASVPSRTSAPSTR